MASCEKCWSDAYFRVLEDPMKSQTEHYQDLLIERVDIPCSPEEQAGLCATKCDECGQITVHQYAKVCCSCGKDYKKEPQKVGNYEPLDFLLPGNQPLEIMEGETMQEFEERMKTITIHDPELPGVVIIDRVKI